jgi:putative membrane protein
MKFLIRWAITAAALVVAVWVVPGITVGHNAIWAVAVTAAVVALVNVFVRPILQILGCGLIVLTLGLFLLVINGLALWLAAYISEHWLHVNFHVSGFWAAFFGALIVSVVSWLLSLAFRDKLDTRRS